MTSQTVLVRLGIIFGETKTKVTSAEMITGESFRGADCYVIYAALGFDSHSAGLTLLVSLSTSDRPTEPLASEALQQRIVLSPH